APFELTNIPLSPLPYTYTLPPAPLSPLIPTPFAAGESPTVRYPEVTPLPLCRVSAIGFPWKIPAPRTSNVVCGLAVPIPTSPPLVTTKLVPVVEPITNAGAAPFVPVGLTESCAHGAVVAIPKNPPPVNLAFSTNDTLPLYPKAMLPF